MYVVYNNGNAAFLNANDFWSSTEDDNSFAWLQNFFTGNQYRTSKDVPNNVRAVRAF